MLIWFSWTLLRESLILVCTFDGFRKKKSFYIWYEFFLSRIARSLDVLLCYHSFFFFFVDRVFTLLSECVFFLNNLRVISNLIIKYVIDYKITHFSLLIIVFINVFLTFLLKSNSSIIYIFNKNMFNFLIVIQFFSKRFSYIFHYYFSKNKNIIIYLRKHHRKT